MISFRCIFFILNGALFGDDVKKNRVRPYHNGYMAGWAASQVRLGNVSSDQISLKRRACVSTDTFKTYVSDIETSTIVASPSFVALEQ